MSINKFFLFFIPFLISSIILFLSFNDVLWIKLWEYINIPAQLPAFSDFDSISKALISKLDGHNPYINNPYDLTNKPYSYTSIWLNLFEILNLDIDLNFQILCFLLFFLYFFVLLKILNFSKDKRFQFLLIILYFSTSNLLVIERLNIEIIIFILVYFIALKENIILRIVLFFTALFAKLYPIFTIFIFSKNIKILFCLIFFSILAIFLMREEIIQMMNNSIEYALLASHGIPSLTKGFWYYSTKYNFFINDDNYIIFKYFSILAGAIYASIIFFFNFKFQNKNIDTKMDLDEKFIICGSGIYIGRFITFGNFDYALIFLIFTLPYIFKNSSGMGKYFYFILLIICFNSLLLEGGDKYSLLYFSKSTIIHIFKIIIFTINCYFFAKVLNKHLKFNFGKKVKYE